MYICSRFLGESKASKVLIACPHGSDGRNFFDKFPEILNHKKIEPIRTLFQNYVAIEQDRGSHELAHELARFLENKGISSIVFEMDYPRAIVDGGRILDHCLRPCLPPDLFNRLKDKFLDMHQDMLHKLEELHEEVNQNHGYVLDLHTMASFSPHHKGEIKTIPVSFENLEEYYEQFINAPREKGYLRYVDVITEDGHGHYIADRKLAKAVSKNLSLANIDYRENSPYFAPPEFLMNTHMSRCPGLAIDIPKHLLAAIERPEDFALDGFQLCYEKIGDMAQILGNGLMDAVKT